MNNSNSTDLKPIETIYNGLRFRSRLEARWAVFFYELGIKYKYEIEGYEFDGIRYLPDFWLADKDCWAEIKGSDQPHYFAKEQRISDDLYKCMLLAQHSKKSVLLLCGQIPALNLDLTKHGFPEKQDDFYCLQIQGVTWLEVTPKFDFYGNSNEYPLEGLEVCWPHFEYSWLYNENALLKARQARFEYDR